MTRLDEHLRRELERAGRPADPTGVYEELIRRRERRHIARRLEAGVVALAVSVGSLVGIWALTRGSGGPIAAPGGEDVIAAVLAGPRPASSSLAIISAQDGSIRTLLAMDRAEAPPVAWSPDGDRLAFWRVAEPSDAEPAGLYTVDLEGGEPSLLFATDLSILDLAWSPDGQRIAFVEWGQVIPGDLTGRTMPMPTLYTVAADGTDLREIQVGRDVHPREVAWSPDGSTLAVTDAGDVLLVDLASGTVTRLPDDGLSSSPAWSPDGREIAFEGGPNAGLQSLFVMNADGTGRRRLTNPDGADGSPTWSPDGRWIAVVRLLPTPTGPSGALGPSGVAGPSGPLGVTCQVVLVAADASGERVLLDGPIDDACPSELAWRPAPGPSIAREPATGA